VSENALGDDVLLELVGAALAAGDGPDRLESSDGTLCGTRRVRLRGRRDAGEAAAHWRDVQQMEHVLGKYIISDKPMTEEQWIRERATLIDVTPEK
jgi:hypothetical protein